ncbi:MAG TPA: cytochrome b/b6 domain-containing protein, partial [Hyphomicrobium sp.]|nr:cytochrome b/b6 domain-containing protein [Hyphomicrobium sp.]
MADIAATPQHAQIVYRHSLAVRITHWVNALCLLVLLLSGLQIFNAHPTLYLGSTSEPDRAILSMDAVQRDDG